MNARRIGRAAIAIAFLILGFAALRDLVRLGPALPWKTMDDFPDFYCAGWALNHREDPYLYEPLHTCEHRVNAGDSFRARLFQNVPWVAVPAPLPAYDFLPLMALARFPFEVARAVFAVALVAAVLLTLFALIRLGIPWEAAAAALLLSTAYAALNTGQIVPFALLTLVLCSLAIARGVGVLTGVAAAFTLFEPIVGLPVVVAVLLYVPGARASLSLCLLALAAVSYYLVGPHVLGMYLTAVLPAQAAAELHFPFQYSLTYVLAFFGASPDAARLAGTASYFLMMSLGLLAAPAATRYFNKPELIVLVPAFSSAIGGAYLHPEELCFAIPALLVLSFAAKGTLRSIFGLALCALALPWIVIWGEKHLFLAGIFVCAVILARVGSSARFALTALFFFAAIIYAFELRGPHLPVPSASSIAFGRSELVEDAWHQYAQSRATADPMWLAIKLPAWVALLAALGALVRATFKGKGMTG